MSKSGKTSQEFIQNSFSPLVAVISSSKVNNVVSKNNLSFVELLQPFTLFEWEGQFREPTGSVCFVRNWKLNIRDVNWKPLQPTEARKQLNNAVILNYNENTVSIDVGSHKIEIPQHTTWFDAWRETYFEVQFPSDHEFTKHFLACMLVASTQDDNIIDTYNSLLQQLGVLQNVTPPKLPKWFNNDILKSFVLLHDSSTGNKDKVQAMFNSMQQTFGSHNCFLLSINSKNASELDKVAINSDLWAPYIRRSETQGDLLHPHSNLPYSSLESSYSAPTVPANAQEEISTFVTTEPYHPLSPQENDIYDKANSLQNNSLSGSVESVSIDRKTSDITSEIHGAALSASDLDAIKQFLKEFSSKALLPYFERQISLLSDVVANRKGVSRSLLSATKRWFGTGKGGGTTGTNNVIYSNDCPELQLRRLGDLWFMAGQWHRAFETYHTAKREFYADGAWLCYAGALEMAAISAFMSGEAAKKTYGYMEESITTYLNTCRMVQYAVRATLLSVLCLSDAGMYGEAAKQLIRMTSEDSDLRSAMLLEQAALSFLSSLSARGMARKYAFHMVLAGHRFSKAGQKGHAYRCYQQAYQIYKEGGWRLASDHVQFALGRLAGSLKQTQHAVRWLIGPLAPGSPQPLHQQHAFLREYFQAHQQWVDSCGDKSRLQVLPLPLVSALNTVVLCAGTPPLAAPRRVPASSLTINDTHHQDKHWRVMEQMLIQVVQGSLPMIFKPTVNLHTKTTDNVNNPTVPQGEPVQISITLINFLKLPLTLLDIELLWEFYPASEDCKEPLANEYSIAADVPLKSNVISGPKIKSFILEGDSEKSLVFTITPLHVGELHISGLAYKLCNGSTPDRETYNGAVISGKVILEIPKANKENTQVKDKRLQIKVIPCSPCLQMTFSEIESNVISGQLQTVDVEFRNVGPVEMKNLHLAFSHPECISLATSEQEVDDFQSVYAEKYHVLDNMEERMRRAATWRARAIRHVRSVRAQLGPGGSARATLHVRASATTPRIHLLAYYDAADTPHRLLSHTFQFKVVDMVKVVAVPRRYIKLNDNKSALETMSLCVEVQNDASESNAEITLDVLEASLLSRQWKFTDFIVSKDKSESLKLHEKLHLILRAKRITDTLTEGKVEWSSLKINQKHAESLPDINSPPFSNFVVDYKTSAMNDDIYALENDKRSSGLIQSTLVIRWKISRNNKGDNKLALGQSYLWIDCFSLQHSEKLNNSLTNEMTCLNFEENDSSDDVVPKSQNSAKKEDIVVFKMEHSNDIIHSFKERKICIIPVVIHFVNCYGRPVKAFMTMSSKGDGAEVGWAGALSCGTDANEWGVGVSLEAFESQCVQVRALVSAPGTYLLGGATTLTCKPLQSDVITQHCNNSSILIVRDSSCI